MGYLYFEERAKMEERYKKFAEEYREAYEIELKEGKVPKTDLEVTLKEIYDFDLDVFNRDRSYITHTVSYHEKRFPSGNKNFEEVSEENTPLLKGNLEHFSKGECEICEWERYSWIEDIDNAELYRMIKSLSQQDIEILTLKIVDDKKQTEIAKIYGVSNAAISKRIKCISKKAKKILQKG